MLVPKYIISKRYYFVQKITFSNWLRNNFVRETQIKAIDDILASTTEITWMDSSQKKNRESLVHENTVKNTVHSMRKDIQAKVRKEYINPKKTTQYPTNKMLTSKTIEICKIMNKLRIEELYSNMERNIATVCEKKEIEKLKWSKGNHFPHLFK